jgi:hypothetical protein
LSSIKDLPRLVERRRKSNFYTVLIPASSRENDVSAEKAVSVIGAFVSNWQSFCGQKNDKCNIDFIPTWKPLQVGLLPRTIFDPGLRFTSCSWFVQSEISPIAETFVISKIVVRRSRNQKMVDEKANLTTKRAK